MVSVEGEMREREDGERERERERGSERESECEKRGVREERVERVESE